MKKIVTGLFCLLAVNGISQNVPTIVSFSTDTLCYGDYGQTLIYNIVVEDLNADSTYLNIVSYNAAKLNNVVASSPAFIPGQTLRTFTITADAGTGLAAGLNTDIVGVDLIGNTSNDGGNGYTTFNAYIYGYLPLTFNLSPVTMCQNGNPIDIRPYALPAGGVFTWAGQTGYMFDPEIYLNNGSGLIYYDYVNAAGCSNYTVSNAPVLLTPPTISLSPSATSCGIADGFISAAITGIAPPYQLYWSNGVSELVTGTPTPLSGLSAGNYYANVTDANGCKAVALGQLSDNEVDLSETITNETCLNSSADGEVDLSIFVTMGNVDFIYWSNGQTTSTLSGVSKGEYTVEVRTDAGCEANGSYFVDALPQFYAENVNSTDATCSASDGVVDIGLVNGSGNYTFSWSNGATTEDLMGVPSGTYTCQILDNISGCATTYKHDIYSSYGPGAYLNYVIQPTCGQNDGAINLNVYPYSAAISSVSWSSGQTTPEIENIPAGSYELTVTALDGCVFNHTITLGSLAPEPPQICMLSVDTSLIYNMVVWEKDMSQPNIAGYKVYRETSQYGVFELVSTRPYALESIFQDNDASPVDRSWRYYITAYDACGNESAPSYVHKTIHVVVNTSNGTDYNVTWDNYEGFTYSSVDIFRFDSTNGWQNIANIPFGTNTYTDVPPIYIGLDYMVEFNLSFTCTSSKAQDHNSTRSNKTASVFEGGGTTVQIIDEDLGVISIYPNPASSAFTIHVDQPDQVQYFEITDINGNLILTGSINTNNTLVESSEMAAGIYLIKLYSASNIVTQKLIVN
jgi:hypothetical protein